MFTRNDEYSNRPVAMDAQPALQAFRDGGNVYFHLRDIEELRQFYVDSSQKNGLTETQDIDEKDYQLSAFGVRVYDPRPESERAEATPVILFMHGGGWVMGNLATHESVVRRLAVLTGFPAVAVDYRLAPEHPYPAAIDDCREALAWLVESTDHGLKPTGVSVVGDSAGGQLAAILANENNNAEAPVPIVSQVLLYPVIDITEENMSASSSYQRIQEGFPLIKDTMAWFADSYVEGGEVRKRPDLSPMFAELTEPVAPAYVLTVDNDPLSEEGGKYAAKLAAAGTPVRYEHLIGYAHGIFTSAGVIPQGERSLAEAAEFITKYAG